MNNKMSPTQDSHPRAHSPAQPRTHAPALRHTLRALAGAAMLCCGAALNAQSTAPAAPAAAKPAAQPATQATTQAAATRPANSSLTQASATRLLDAAPVAGDASATPQGNYRLTFKQLGNSQPLNLRGIDGRVTIPFSVRADEVVTKATLKINYAYSPDLITETSKINVLINGEVAASLALPKETAGSPVSQTITLPAALITEYNQLSLQLIGHYTTACEDPHHSSLWAVVSHHGVLELSTEAAPLGNDLALLPEPFFDPRDGRVLNLPVVFAGAPDNNTLEAAGTLASWFGMRAKGRVLNFPASVDALPAKGHAVVFITGKAAIAGLALPSPTGPALAVVVNPNDPNGKLLLVQGRDGKDLKLAAATLSSVSKTLAGPSLAITQALELRARKPYDAPNWLRSDRPVKFGELVDPQTLNVTGYDAGDIVIGMRLPPDLYRTKDDGVSLDLKYRYTPRSNSAESSVLLRANGSFLKSLLLLPMERLNGAPLLAKLQADGSLPMQYTARIPLGMLPARSQLSMRYMYDVIKEGECRDIRIDNMRGAIDPESTLDISSYSHHLAMPNLGAFGSSGYPFSRLADLSQTAVVLSDAPQPQELSTYLNLLGRLGEATGLAGTAVTVGRGAEVAEFADKDLLVIATGADQPLLKRWAKWLPSGLDAAPRSDFSLGLSALWTGVKDWVVARSPQSLQQGDAATTQPSFSSAGLTAYVAGFESPMRLGRSVVLFWGAEPAALETGVEALLGADGLTPKIGSGLSIVRGQKVDVVNTATTYFVSDLDWFTRARLMLADHMGWLLLVAATGMGLVAVLIRKLLRAQVKKRSGT